MRSIEELETRDHGTAALRLWFLAFDCRPHAAFLPSREQPQHGFPWYGLPLTTSTFFFCFNNRVLCLTRNQGINHDDRH